MSEQRKNQRFELKLPIELVKAGGEGIPQVGETRNLSSGGVLFTSDGRLQKGNPIEYLVTLPAHGDEAGLRLRCMGEVVRGTNRISGGRRGAASVCHRGNVGTSRIPAAVKHPNLAFFIAAW